MHVPPPINQSKRGDNYSDAGGEFSIGMTVAHRRAMPLTYSSPVAASTVALFVFYGLNACGGVASRAVGEDAAIPVETSATDAGAPLGSLDTPCGDAGLTGRQLLRQLQPAYTGAFDYDDAGPTGTTNVTFAAQYDGGVVLCTPTTVSCQGGLGCGSVPYSAIVSLDVQISFQTADGAFNEHFAGTTAWDGLDSINVNGNIPTSSHVGTFHPSVDPGSIEFNLFGATDRDGGSRTYGAVLGLSPSGGAVATYGSFGY
jgi:hypothetical protein